MVRKTKNAGQVILALLNKNERKIRSFFRKRFPGHQDIDDLTQEVFIRAFKAAQDKEIDNPDGYLFGIARYVMLSEMAKRSRSVVDYVEDITTSADLTNFSRPDQSLESREAWAAFAEAVATLPPQCQRVFILKKVYGYSNKAISAELGISTSTVEKHIALGLRRTSAMLFENKAELSGNNGAVVTELRNTGKK